MGIEYEPAPHQVHYCNAPLGHPVGTVWRCDSCGKRYKVEQRRRGAFWVELSVGADKRGNGGFLVNAFWTSMALLLVAVIVYVIGTALDPYPY